MNKLWKIATSAVSWYWQLSLLAKVALPIATVGVISTFAASVKLQSARSEARRWQREAEQHKLRAADRKLEIDSLKLALQKQQNVYRIQQIRAERKQAEQKRRKVQTQRKLLRKQSQKKLRSIRNMNSDQQLKFIQDFLKEDKTQ